MLASGWVGEKTEKIGIFPLLCGLMGSFFLALWSEGEIHLEVLAACARCTIPQDGFVF